MCNCRFMPLVHSLNYHLTLFTVIFRLPLYLALLVIDTMYCFFMTLSNSYGLFPFLKNHKFFSFFNHLKLLLTPNLKETSRISNVIMEGNLIIVHFKIYVTKVECNFGFLALTPLLKMAKLNRQLNQLTTLFEPY